LFEPTPKAKAINQKNEGARKNEGAHVAIKLKSGRAMIEKEEREEREEVGERSAETYQSNTWHV
jgi:hypothetical protein